MSLFLPFDGTVAPQQNDYSAIPDGTKLIVNITPTRKNSTAIEVRDFAGSGPNAHIKTLHPRFVVADGQKYQGRNIFERIPFARKYGSGKTVGTFFQFFGALGFDTDNPQGFEYDDRMILGKQVEVVVGVRKDQNGADENHVKFFNPAKPGGGTPYQTSAPAQPAQAAPASFGTPNPWAAPEAPAQPVQPTQQAPQHGAQGQPDWLAQPDPAQSLNNAASAVAQGF